MFDCADRGRGRDGRYFESGNPAGNHVLNFNRYHGDSYTDDKYEQWDGHENETDLETTRQ